MFRNDLRILLGNVVTQNLESFIESTFRLFNKIYIHVRLTSIKWYGTKINTKSYLIRISSHMLQSVVCQDAGRLTRK